MIKIYSPQTVATYCVTILPVGIFLHGLNYVRRSQAMWGITLMVFGLLLFPCFGIGALTLIMGQIVLKLELSSHNREVLSDIELARWWGPLLLYCVPWAAYLGTLVILF